jgi:acyl-coenzyme A thioesterase PaaI-like protein
MSGIEYLQHLPDSGRDPPIGALLDFRLVRIEPGRAVFSGTPSEFHYNPIGAVHGGFAATLLDSALGCAVHTLKAELRRSHRRRSLTFLNGKLSPVLT